VVGRSVFRGLLWGLLAVVVVLLVVVTVATRRSAAAPPVLSALPDFSLVNRDGATVTRGDLAGAVWIADFVFTRCPGPCPLMTRRLAELGPRLPPGVRRVSFTVDPDHDTPQVLAGYAAGFGAPDSWLFLTGPRHEIWDLAAGGFKLAVADAAAMVDTPDVADAAAGEATEQGPILHSTRFVLVDGRGRIRGYYDGFEPGDLDRLVREARAVAKEPGG
jgi:protein SCO1